MNELHLLSYIFILIYCNLSHNEKSDWAACHQKVTEHVINEIEDIFRPTQPHLYFIDINILN